MAPVAVPGCYNGEERNDPEKTVSKPGLRVHL